MIRTLCGNRPMTSAENRSVWQGMIASAPEALSISASLE
jgi:hypothetical protein